MVTNAVIFGWIINKSRNTAVYHIKLRWKVTRQLLENKLLENFKIVNEGAEAKETSKLPLNFDDMTSQATAGQYNAAQKASKMAEI